VRRCEEKALPKKRPGHAPWYIEYTDDDLRKVAIFKEYGSPQVYSVVEEQFIPTPPPTGSVFHYTSSEGMRGILSNEAIFVNHISSQSDRDEASHGLDILQNTFEQLSEEWDDAVSRVFVDFIRSRDSGNRDKPSIYVTSFCNEGDRPFHWHEYGQAGTGWCIGLDFFHIRNAKQLPYKFNKCIYSDIEKRTRIRNILIQLVAHLKNDIRCGLHYGAINEWYAFEFLENIIPNTIFFKQEEFYEETEWRLITSSKLLNRQPAVRYSSGEPIEYFNFNLPSRKLDNVKFLPISHLIAGPCVDENEINEVRELLDNKGYGYVSIYTSTVNKERFQ
jgi:hypothetical protein